MEGTAFCVYSTKPLDRNFGFGRDPIVNFRDVEGIIINYGILFYRDNAKRPVGKNFVIDAAYRGPAFFSQGTFKDDWSIVSWEEIYGYVPPKRQKQFDEHGDSFAWCKLNQPVEIFEINENRGTVSLRK